ncbi:peptidyl-prolyl cis-trans isomerase [bacterium]|nr:peptidyl-prolyl cis-trans isomerase [bacterium]
MKIVRKEKSDLTSIWRGYHRSPERSTRKRALFFKFRWKILTAFVTAVLSFLAAGCQKSSDESQPILAHTGETTISLREFQKRFELTPRLHHFSSLQEAKRSALLSLAAEKTLAIEGYKHGLDSDPIIRRLLREIEREVVIEQVYREHVRKKVTVTEAEVRQAYQASKHLMRVRYFSVLDSLEALKAEEMLKQGSDFSNVAQIFIGDLTPENGWLPVKVMEWGKSDERLEEAALELKPGESSGPVRVGHRTFFLYMEQHLVDRFASEDDFQQQRPRLEKVVVNRKENRVFAEFLVELMTDSQVRAEPQVYGWLVRNLEKALDIKNSSRSDNTMLRKEIEWDQMASDLSDQFHRELLTFKSGHWTVGEFLERLWFGSYPVNTNSKSDFRVSVYKVIERMVEDEFLYREGMRQDLDELASVQEEMEIWRESLVAAQMRKALTDTISLSDRQVRAHFSHHRERFGEPEMVKVQEILVQDASLAKELTQKIRQGADMTALAREYSKRKTSRDAGGVLGFFQRNAYGKLGQAAFRARLGKLQEPVQVGPYAFSVFKVLERKPPKPGIFKDVKHLVRADLHQERTIMAINKFLTKVGAPWHVEWQAIDTLQVSAINLLTVKVGFSGRMAAPMIEHLEGIEGSLSMNRPPAN